MWYISDISKFKKDYIKWKFRYNIDDIIKDLYISYKNSK